MANRTTTKRPSRGSSTRTRRTRSQESGARERAPRETKERKNKRYLGIFNEFQAFALGYLVLILALNALCWISSRFCDFYVRYCHPIFLNTYGRFTSLFPFSVGEVMLVLAVILCVVAAFMWIPLFRNRKHKKKTNSYYISRFFYRVFVMIVLNVAMIMTLNCATFYHRSKLDPNPEVEAKAKYSGEELMKLRTYLVKEANALADTMPRDENGYVTYDGDLQTDCVAALRHISGRYPMLKGFYPKVKRMMFSDLMCQMYMEGYYFPFSLEANVNKNMYITQYPACYAHELAHTKGYLLENEANLLAFEACMESSNDFLRYSGILSVLSYVENDCYESFGEDLYNHPDYVFWNKHILELDMSFLPPGKMEEIEKDAIISTEVVDKVTTTVTDTSLKVNGVTSGITSYSEVVGLLLEYYDGKLY